MRVAVGPLYDIPVQRPGNCRTLVGRATVFAVPERFALVRAFLVERVTVHDQSRIAAFSQNALQGPCR